MSDSVEQRGTCLQGFEEFTLAFSLELWTRAFCPDLLSRIYVIMPLVDPGTFMKAFSIVMGGYGENQRPNETL